jgi:hypothetical protein
VAGDRDRGGCGDRSDAAVAGRQAPVVRVVSEDGADAAKIANAVTAAGFRIDPLLAPAATVLVADRLPVTETATSLPRPTWIVNAATAAPNVRVMHVAAPASRLPGQGLDVIVEIRGEGVRGKTTEVMLEDAGLPVASASHTWTADEESWRATLQYLPPYAVPAASASPPAPTADETTQADNAADLLVPPTRGPVRVLVLEAAVTWPALFVRRVLEGESAFAISASQRAAKSVVTRAGAPPPALTRDSMAPYEVAVVGGPGNFRAADVEVLRWFVEDRGGVVLFVPDERPAGNYLALTGIAAFDVAALEEPVRVGGLLASELAIPRNLPAGATVLAADPQRRPVVVSWRRGAGAVILSGALDAWRHRGADEEAFARFWRQTIAGVAASVPPPLQISIEPAIARPGDAVRISVRLRDSELAAGDRASVTLDAARDRSQGERRIADQAVADRRTHDVLWRLAGAACRHVQHHRVGKRAAGRRDRRRVTGCRRRSSHHGCRFRPIGARVGRTLVPVIARGRDGRRAQVVVHGSLGRCDACARCARPGGVSRLRPCCVPNGRCAASAGCHEPGDRHLRRLSP